MSEYIYESDDMSILDTIADLEKIEQIIISIYLYQMKVYDYITDLETIKLYEPNEILLAPSHEIDFMKNICRTISYNGGIYKIVITIITQS